MSSSVPLGGHLFSFLFSLFISILFTLYYFLCLCSVNWVVCDSQFLAFVDDMKIFLRINPIQNYLNKLLAWANTLLFNVSKCHSITFTRSKTSFKFTNFINNNPISCLNNLVHDLGFILKWKLIIPASTLNLRFY